MPSGKTHLRIELALLGVAMGGGIALLRIGRIGQHEILAFAGAYVLSMVLLSPDLDLTRSHAYRRWGWLRWLWLPYAAIFKHRQLSHHVLWGPMSRIVYLLLWGLVAGFVYMVLTRRALVLPDVPPSLLASVIVGLYVPNLAHILSDRVHTAWRRRRAGNRL